MGIFVITHKYIDKKPKLSDGYKWLYVGAYKQDERRREYCFDDIGVNISELNDKFCELTGLYWIRHNSHDDIKGLTHYRRFFTHNPLTEQEKYFLSNKEIEETLKEYECIVASRLFFPDINIYAHYKRAHYEKDLKMLEATLLEVSPNYHEAYKKAFSENYMFPYNMLIARRDIFDEYCDWLFKLLFELQKKENLSSYSEYQGRVYGFLSERLLHVWLIHNHIKFKEIPVVQIGGRFRYRARICIERMIKRSFFIKK